MKEILFRWARLGFLMISFALFANTAYAQETEGSEESAETEAAADDTTTEATTDDEVLAEDSEYIEELVVTGSRLKRSTFESISPLQVIDAESSREAGLIDTGEILQGSSQASGEQVDLTYNGFVLDNGPGAVTLNLRGLSAGRTLILINGRRVSPAGVEGAPSSPDLNLVPGTLTQRTDLLLDGASSVYGSDAIAGVANIILRKDFDGVELSGFLEIMEQPAKSQENFTVTWGKNFDRGLIGAAFSMQSYPHVSTGESAFLNRPCIENYEIDQNGNIRRENAFRMVEFGMDHGNCLGNGGPGAARIQVPSFGGVTSIWSTPGFTNGNWPGFSEDVFSGFWNDADGDGLNDVSNLLQYGDEKFGFGTLYQALDRFQVMSYGEYTFDNAMNTTAYFEVLQASRETESRTVEGQLFPWVNANNPFNICNPNAPNGVDCGLAWDAWLNQPNLQEKFLEAFGCNPSPTGCYGFIYLGEIGPSRTRPIVRIKDNRNRVNTDLTQTRTVAGVTTDLPWLSFGSLSGWSLDASVTYSHAAGTSFREGILSEQLEIGLGNYSSTGTPCLVDAAPAPVDPEDLVGCVPINLYSPTLYTTDEVGDFATQAEHDYLFGRRTFDTQYTQTLFAALASGTLFNLPYGSVEGAVGIEVREDELESIPNRVAGEGLLWGFFADQGASGKKTTQEAFFEMEVPLLETMFFPTDNLTLNVSARLTDDEYYGSASTWSAKAGYRPVDSLLLRATHGTSFRAPDLRSLFLAGQTGFRTLSDPCLIPAEALDELTGEYLPGDDKRRPILLKNCALNGIDPTDPAMADAGGFNRYSVEIKQGGALDLLPEKSHSLSIGFVFEQPWTNAFDLRLGASYYQIDVDDTIIEPGSGFIINDCYYDEESDSRFCSRITREPNADGIPVIDLLDAGFINRDNEQVRGIDMNLIVANSFTLMDLPFELGVDITAHRLLERSTLYLNDLGEAAQTESVGEWGFNEHKMNIRVTLDRGNWRVGWTPRYLGSVEVDSRSEPDFDDIDGASYACLGPPDDVLCKDIVNAESYWVHNVFARYAGFAYNVAAGISNVTNQAPPFVSGRYYGGLYNHPYGGYGYDLTGRTTYVSVSYRFGQ